MRLSPLRKIKRWHERRRERSALEELISAKSAQLEKFRNDSRRFGEIYAGVRNAMISDFVTPQWILWNRELENELLPEPMEAFLQNPTIAHAMFVQQGGRMMRDQLDYLEKTWPREQLKRLIEEDAPGYPRLGCPLLKTSHNSIHHAYHYSRFSTETGADLNKINHVVEWGGGYGNQAKIFLRMAPDNVSYTIIDTPLFSCLQYIYLRSVMPNPDRVHLYSEGVTSPPVSGEIRILPLGVAQKSELHCDLFVSTWALSESTDAAQDHVLKNGWFGAKHLLLAFQNSSEIFPFAERITALDKTRTIRTTPIDLLPGNYYGFS